MVLSAYYAASQDARSINGRLRTDDFYFYDNGIDTFKIMPGSKDLFIEFAGAIKQRGLCPPGKSKCQPDSIAVLRDGSPLMHYIAFFSDTSGTAFEPNCRDKETTDNAIKTIKARKTGTDTSCFAKFEHIHKVVFTNDSTFTFFVQDDQFYRERYRAVITKDALLIHVINDDHPFDSPFPDRRYTLIPYNNIPADFAMHKK